ncbi:MAG: class I tRNA ligase family protein [bacterium]|nr:class I tRNA ligase family protein [bacterium]
MKYNPQKIEKKWQKAWRESRIYETDFSAASKPFYNLMMFPYPSAEGLHVGNMYAFTGADIYGRAKRMQGYDVFEPIGLDGFGIHSENYAMKIGAHPASQAKVSEKRFYKQMDSIGNGFAWDEKVETYNPEYYKWTQWIFIQMFKKGLAYRKKAEVNWCTSCLTVLSDEQVLIAGDPSTALRAGGGKCERCGSVVIKKELEQWFFKITDYAEKLLKNLDSLDWSEKVKIAQRNWIGKSEGAVISFALSTKHYPLSTSSIEVFTTRPDTIMGVTFIAVAHGSVYAGKIAIHPVTDAEIPVYATDYVVADYGTAAVMGVPAHDERDRAFAEAHGIYISDEPLLPYDEALKKCGGKKETRFRLRDWLISRQRYWGPPIPMIHCETCDWQPVPESELPVLLPRVKNFRPEGTGKSPLASIKSFYEATCPECGGKARRETDVSDTFLDSSWYYLGYLFQHQAQSAALPTNHYPLSTSYNKWLPVDMYIGGAEHSVLHLLYSRFLTMALKDMGHVDFEEPFTIFRAHGLLIKEGAKMSKSKGNVINPDEYIERYGADTLRTYLMFLAPFAQGGDFRDESVMGIYRFLNRVWALASGKLTAGSNGALQKAIHKTVKKVTEDIADLKYNTAISAMMILLRELEAGTPQAEDVKTFLKLLAPFAPHITEELWGMLGEAGSIHTSAWPAWDAKFVEEDEFDLVIQINGKTKRVIKAPKGIGEAEAVKLAAVDGIPKRVIFVPNRLINFII